MKTSVGCFLAALALVACGAPDAGEDGGLDATTADAYTPPAPDGGGAEDDAGSGLDAGSMPDDDAGPPDAGEPACVCDDAIDCTIDRCTDDGCVFEPIHHRCAPGEFCGDGGCAPGAVCSSDADCPTDTDACTTSMRCDLALRQCTWNILDGDGDGHAPLVCGGLDCADATPGASPDASEACNGADDDCDGVIDDGASCGAGLACVAGECVCPAGEEWCGEALGCRSLSGDPLACGTCATACVRSGALCDSGTCVCPAGSSECSDACADLDTSTQHCGACENACAPGATCTGGRCACPAGATECTSGCVVLASDVASCGACDRRCLDGASCAAGECSSTIGFLRGFQSSSTGLVVDGLLTHPSGEMTLLLRFGGTLDELPFRGITSSSGRYLTRRSATGEEIWSRLLRSAGDTLELAGSPGREDFALVGRITSSTDFGGGAVLPGAGALAVARYDGTGALSWTRITRSVDPTDGGPYYYDATMHPDGAVSVLVGLNDPVDFGGGPLGPSACCSHWGVVRYAAADGAHLASWELPVIGSSGLRGDHIEAAPAGGVVVAGSYTGGAAVFGPIVLPGPTNAFVATYTAAGVPSHAFVSPVTGSGFSLAVDALAVAADGDVFIAGSTLLLGRFAPDGTMRWALPPVDPSAATTAFTWALSTSSDGDVLLRGEQRGHFDFGGGPMSGAYGSIVAQYRPDGSFVRARGFARDELRSTTSITQFARAASGAWVIAGGFTEPLVVQDRTLRLTYPPAYMVMPSGAYFLSFTP